MSSKLAIKTGIAASLALIVAEFLHWQHPFYAVIAAIIVMGSTAGSTWRAGVQRLLGTVIGALAGAIFTSLLGSNPGTLGITVILTLFVSYYWGFNEAAKLAGYVSSIVILNYSQDPFYYAWGRFLETFLGIAIAWGVNALFFPSRVAEELTKKLSQLLSHQGKLYQIAFDCYISGIYQPETTHALKEEIIEIFRQIRELRKELKTEHPLNQENLLSDEICDFFIRRIWEHILTMDYAASVRNEDKFWKELSPQLTQLSLMTSLTFNNIVDTMAEKNYHLPLPNLDEPILATTERLNQLQKEDNSDCSVDELVRFFAFFYSMEEIAQKLQKLASRL